MVTPDGQILRLEVIDDLPYLSHTAMPAQKGKNMTYPGWYHSKCRFAKGTKKTVVHGLNAFRCVDKWVADNGSGHGLIGAKSIANKERIRKAAIPMQFYTTNGDTYTDKVGDEVLTTLSEMIKTDILED